jgi:hypothetical protein
MDVEADPVRCVRCGWRARTSRSTVGAPGDAGIGPKAIEPATKGRAGWRVRPVFDTRAGAAVRYLGSVRSPPSERAGRRPFLHAASRSARWHGKHVGAALEADRYAPQRRHRRRSGRWEAIRSMVRRLSPERSIVDGPVGPRPTGTLGRDASITPWCEPASTGVRGGPGNGSPVELVSGGRSRPRCRSERAGADRCAQARRSVVAGDRGAQARCSSRSPRPPAGR